MLSKLLKSRVYYRFVPPSRKKNDVGPDCFKMKKLFRLAASIDAFTMSLGCVTHGTARDIFKV